MDAGFIGFNNYSRPDQLTSGMLASSLNGRIGKNGEWQVRKGINVIKAPFASGDDVLRLPTNAETLVNPPVVGLLPTTIRSASLDSTSSKVSIIIDDPSVDPGHVFVVGDEVYVENLVGTTTYTPFTGSWTSSGLSTTIEDTTAYGNGVELANSSGTYGTSTITLSTPIPSGTAVSIASTVIEKTGTWKWEFLTSGGLEASPDYAQGIAVTGSDTVTTTAEATQIRIRATHSGTLKVSNISVTSDEATAGVTTTTTDPNGLHTITDVTDNGATITIKYALTGANETYAVALTLPFNLDDGGVEPQLTVLTESSVIGFNMVLEQGNVTAVYASTTFSDPNQDNNQFIVLASNVSAVATDLNDTSVSITMGYPLNENVPPASSMLQAFNRIFIFRDGQTALENDSFFSPMLIASSSINTTKVVTANTSLDHNLKIGDAITISGVTAFTAGEDPNGTFVVATVPSATQFTYVLVGSSTSSKTFTVGVASFISPGFKLASSGEYTQPVPMALSDIDYSDGIATATTSVASVSTLLVGDTLTFTAAGSSTYTAGDTVRVRSIESSTTFTFVTDKGDLTNKNGSVQKQVSVGLGFSHMPAPEYAAYHQRRLVMPFKYNVEDTVDTFTYRKILDEVIISDILDSDTYDKIYGQFRFNAGTSDFNVALHSFSDDKLLVFNRNSVHLVGGEGANATVQLITNEVGCVARQSIVQVGNNILFLSDNGVYGANFQDLYNLRGNEVPLSSSINPTIERINRDVWDKSVGVYFDNRYYLAVPLDGSQVNNAILIFNFINKQWESIDTVNSSATGWNIANLIVAGKKSDRAVYAVNTLGGVHRLDARVGASDVLATEIPVSGQEASVVHSIPASVTTRQFTMGSMDRKRWNNFELHVQSSLDNESDLSISAELENIDAVVELGTLSQLNSGTNLAIDEDVSVRGRIGNKRAYGMQVTLNNTVGRPRFRGIKVGAAEAFRSTNTAI